MGYLMSLPLRHFAVSLWSSFDCHQGCAGLDVGLLLKNTGSPADVLVICQIF